MNVFEKSHERIFGYTDARQSWHGEEIIRCRDCKHSRKDGKLCMFFAAWYPIAGGDEYADVPADVEPDGFCKWSLPRSQRK